MSGAEKDLTELLARIAHRRTDAEEECKLLGQTAVDVFDMNQSELEKLRLKAARGDAKAQAAYLAVVRGRKALAGVRQNGKETV